MQSTPLDPTSGGERSQTEHAVLALREMLLRGDFQPGERLTELALAPLLNVSRTPLRLALERLSNQGLLAAQPTGGFRVREFTLADIWDAIEIRGVLEGTAARLAAERLSSPDELAELRRSNRDIGNWYPRDEESFVHYMEENQRFHRELWRLAKSPMLVRALEDACALPFAEPGALVFCMNVSPKGVTIAIEHHRAIVEAIENRQGARAESLAHEHSQMARRNLTLALGDRELMRRVPGLSLVPASKLPL